MDPVMLVFKGFFTIYVRSTSYKYNFSFFRREILCWNLMEKVCFPSRLKSIDRQTNRQTDRRVGTKWRKYAFHPDRRGLASGMINSRTDRQLDRQTDVLELNG